MTARFAIGLLAITLATLFVLVAWLNSGTESDAPVPEARDTSLARGIESTATNDNEKSNFVSRDPEREPSGMAEPAPDGSATPIPSQSLDPRWRRLLEIRRSGLDASALTVFVSQRIAEILTARGEWESLGTSETLRLAERMDSNTQFILQSGSGGIRGFRATREEFPLLFELQDLANTHDPLTPGRPKAAPELLPRIRALTEQAILAAP
jgi:hypothetical protein